MNIILTMGGAGARMSERYPQIPKWMVNVKSRLLIDWILDDVVFSMANNIAVVCLRAHQQFLNIEREISARWPKAKVSVVYIDEVTQGQLRTASYAFPLIENDGVTIVRNIDTINYLSDSNIKDIATIGDNDIYLPCFHSNSDQYSYYEPVAGDIRDGYVEGGLAVSGLYIFGAFDLLKAAAESVQGASLATEENMTLAVMRSRSQGACIRYGMMDACVPVGTPDEYDQFSSGERYLVR